MMSSKKSFRRSALIATVFGLAAAVPLIVGGWSGAGAQLEPPRCEGSACTVGIDAAPGGNNWWVLVPGGTFTMGSDRPQTSYNSRNTPPHEVTVSAYFIGRTEVTAGMYRVCMQQGRCSEPVGSNRLPLGERDDPALMVNHQQAREYCAFVGGRLPTEAEWEYAARGPQSLRYPWGNEFDAALVASLQSVSTVGRQPVDTSPFGILDMWLGGEWVWDRMGPYSDQPQRDPQGPRAGASRVVRGGCTLATFNYLPQCDLTLREPRQWNLEGGGFRCAKNAPRRRPAAR